MAAWTRLVASVGLAVMALSGCTYSSQEPGLFPSPGSSTAASPESSRFPPQRTNPNLPVAGERIWVSGGPIPVTTRIAVHAVRRVEGATVLDWSITPLRAEHYAFGDSLPEIELGLDAPGRGSFDPAVSLLDPANAQVYRPLIHSSRRLFNHCLCTPAWRLGQSLRIGETRLQQITFPPLPVAMKFIDVDIPTVTPFSHVPLSPLGTAPSAREATDLARRTEPPKPDPERAQIRYRSESGKTQAISVDHVWAAPGRTTLEWTLSSLSDQESYRAQEYGPPVASPPPPASVFLVNNSPASGPLLFVRTPGGDEHLTASWVTTERDGIVGYECLCTELGVWSSGLRDAGRSVALVTNYPALPPGTRSVEVDLPGFGRFRNVPVTAFEDSARRLGSPRRVETGLWSYAMNDPPQGWPTAEWPTDTPDPAQLSAYRFVVEHAGPLRSVE